ncbi:hypothetical protein [Rhizobium jaguaris]|nr:hypothetical protein [Rhizobium jaguaris]
MWRNDGDDIVVMFEMRLKSQISRINASRFLAGSAREALARTSE